MRLLCGLGDTELISLLTPFQQLITFLVLAIVLQHTPGEQSNKAIQSSDNLKNYIVKI